MLFGGIVFFNKNKLIGFFAIFFGAYYTFFVNGKGEAGQIAVIWIVGAISAYFYKDICAKYFNKKLYYEDCSFNYLMKFKLVNFKISQFQLFFT